jgi:hypothetical protein
VSVRSILVASVRLLAVAASLFCAAPARAGDWAFHGWEPPASYTGEVGLRFWYGKAKTGKNLYDPSGSFLVSRLSYDNLRNVSTTLRQSKFEFKLECLGFSAVD